MTTRIFNYKCGHVYTPDAEGGIKYDDLARINIDWPELDIPYIISDKDLAPTLPLGSTYSYG